MKTNLILATTFMTSLAMAQVMVPDGTKIRVRLEENLSSDAVQVGQTVDFAVTQEVRVGDAIVVANGARGTGSVILAEPRRRMGRAGRLDFTIDRVQLVDGNWLNVRYTPQKNKGKGNATTTSVLTAGLAVAFWPAAPLGLLIRGKDAEVMKGRTYDVFSDDSVYVSSAIAASSPLVSRALPQAPAVMVRQPNGSPINNGNLPANLNVAPNPVLASNASVTSGGFQGAAATLTVNADQPGADIEIDGAFVGNAPSTIQLAPGLHKIAVQQGAKKWERDIQITSGSVSINATLGRTAARLASR